MAYGAMAKTKITIPASTRAYILVQKALISEGLKRMVMHRIDFD